MKKILLFIGILSMYGISNATDEGKFVAIANVTIPATVEISKPTLDFGNVVPGTTKINEGDGITVTIGGEKDSYVKTSFLFNDKPLENGKITLVRANDETGKEGELEATLYRNGNLELEDAYIPVSSANTFEITGKVEVPADAYSGTYISDFVTVKVSY